MATVTKTKGKRKLSGAAALGPGPGRPKGSENKATKNAKEAIARFVDGNAERLMGWLDQIEQEDGPKAAFMCFTDLLEYHVPKLARTIVEGGEKPVQHEHTLRLSEAAQRAIDAVAAAGEAPST